MRPLQNLAQSSLCFEGGDYRQQNHMDQKKLKQHLFHCLVFKPALLYI